MLPHSRYTLCLALVTALTTLVGATASGAAPASLNGKVVNFDGDALAKVTIKISSPDDTSFKAATKSDKDGSFVLDVADASLAYEAEFEKRGFVSMTAKINFTDGQTLERTFTMLTPDEVAAGKAEVLREREKAKVNPATEPYNQGVTAFTAGDLAAARQHFAAAVEANATFVPALSALSLIAMQEESWQEAADFAARTLALDPDDARALMAAYRANKALGRDDVAAEAAAGLQRTGTNADVAGQTFAEGVEAYRARKMKAARELFQQAAELDPTMADAQLALASIYLGQASFDRALAATDKALELSPDNATALKYRFEACLHGGKTALEAAMSDFAAVDPAYVSRAVNERAMDLFEHNKYDDARGLVEKLLTIDSADPRANYILGLILVNAGDNAAARTHLQAFVEAAPDDPDAEAARAMMDAIQ